MPFNFERLSELYGYFEDGDCSYHELQEMRDKLDDLKLMVEDAMDRY
ncbi:MAG: hypothetical protein ACQEXX_01535 [Bacillota bacterium]